ncbi:hypothetical protein Taro_023241 [Colocasia esculenta]|uniref:Zeta toxin domain-containing protein n=1 Tax=Colocasia esculenta TaxID=4460 RepID=A0A843V7S9_COLES|nr:hypothetical protein [Colocasia esculenta]
MTDGIPGHVLLRASAVGLLAAAAATAMRFFSEKTRPPAAEEPAPAPRLVLTDSGRVDELESFAQYVARQMGFDGISECPQLGKLAHDYLKKAPECEDNIFAFFANEPSPESLYVQLVEELDRCILGYFAFHWTHATLLIRQVLTVESGPKKKLKNIVMEATSRKIRFERVTRDLKVTRVFSTLVEEMKAIGMGPNGNADARCTDKMVPAAPSERSPVLLLMGGGMGAGKSTVLKDILRESFWASGAGANAVVVEADAFKETDVIYRALSSRGHHHDMLQTAELVHQSSTDAASSLLVTALNEGRDVIMDGTLSWEPFVEQTIAMARAVHHHRYRMGVGYKVIEDGSVVEDYWEQADDDSAAGKNDRARKPYRIELVGVVCDAYLAVVRGIRRAVIMGRAVRVKSQLKSHQRFASLFPRYCQLVDNARLYCTNAMGAPPKLIGWKDGSSSLLVDPEEIDVLKKVATLNEDADNVHELYAKAGDSCNHPCVWDDVVLSSSRAVLQQELKMAIRRIEGSQS